MRKMDDWEREVEEAEEGGVWRGLKVEEVPLLYMEFIENEECK